MAVYPFDWKTPPPGECRGGAVSFGNFDGVHRGHAALVAALRQQGRAAGGPAVAVTFDPHPLLLLQPERFQPLLTTPDDRAALLHQCGADHVLILRTTPDLLQLSAADFFAEVIVSRLAAKAVVEGPNFGFGRNREGDVNTLQELCGQAGLSFTVVPALAAVDGQPVSSSRIRAALVRGDARAAAGLLDRPYRLRGTVATGQRRGQTLGFPTANLEQVPTLIPGDGVYAVRVKVEHPPVVPPSQGGTPQIVPPSEGGTTGGWPAAANVGPNPTFGEQARKLEVHLIGFQGDLYGRELTVEFLDRLRDTRPFAGRQELVEQLRRDVEQALSVNKTHGLPPAGLSGDSVIGRVKQILAGEIAPALHLDAGAVEVLDLADGVLRVRLGGCGG